MQAMTDDYARQIDELDRLLNDPTVPMQPELIWRLLDKVSEQSRAASKPRGKGQADRPEVSPSI